MESSHDLKCVIPGMYFKTVGDSYSVKVLCLWTTTYPTIKCSWNVSEGPLGGEVRVLLQARCEVEKALVGITQV